MQEACYLFPGDGLQINLEERFWMNIWVSCKDVLSETAGVETLRRRWFTDRVHKFADAIRAQANKPVILLKMQT